jgi:hypothetical protein
MLRKLGSLAVAGIASILAGQVTAQMHTPKDSRVATVAAPVESTQVPSQKVEGGRYPPQPPRMDNSVNSAAPPVPTNPHEPAATTRTSPSTDAKRPPK